MLMMWGTGQHSLGTLCSPGWLTFILSISALSPEGNTGLFFVQSNVLLLRVKCVFQAVLQLWPWHLSFHAGATGAHLYQTLLQRGEKLMWHRQNTLGSSHGGNSGDVWHTAAVAAPREAIQGLVCHWEWWYHLSLPSLAHACRDARPGN